METAVKIIITVLFIALIAIAIVFFGVFGLLPFKKIKVFVDRPAATTTVVEEKAPPTPLVPDTSPVTFEGEVITKSGEPVRLDVLPGTPEAPQQSNPISKEVLPESAIQLEASNAGFAPASFSVPSGEVVTLSLTSTDTQTHVFKFESSALSAVAIGVGPGETRAITFNAPEKGAYVFYCDVPGHRGRGEEGTMTVE